MSESVLIVEDDKVLSENLFIALESEGFLPDTAYNGVMAINRLEQDRFDLLVLDIGLPLMDGLHVLRHIRSVMMSDIPVLILTARTEMEDKVTGFNLGADDYLTKPFSLQEVVLRLRALSRRSRMTSIDDTPIQHGSLEYIASARQFLIGGKAIKLTKKNLQILELLTRYAGKIVSRQMLEQHLWNNEPPSSDALRSQVHILRRVLREHGFEGIETLAGIGWRLGNGENRSA